MPKAFIVKNSIFENTGRFGITAKTSNVVIDSSTFRFNGLAGVALGASFNPFFQEAQPAWNVVLKNNAFENNIRRMSDNTPGGVVVDHISVDVPNINGNLYLFNNTFKDELYAYNLRDAMNIRLWANVYTNVTTPIWRNTPTTSNFTQGVVFNDYVTDDLSRLAIHYSETWPTSSNVLDSMGTITWNNTPGSFAEFHFVGNHISYFARRGSQMGIVDVYLDDVLVLNDFDLYSNATQAKSLIYTNNNLVNTVHTLRIVNTGLRNVNATQGYVNIDFLVHRLGNYIVSPPPVGGVLPVQLLGFEGKAVQKKIELNWKTTNEVNSSHFEMLKLNVNAEFKSIGRVNSKNVYSSHNSYFFPDEKPHVGTNYYQLKQYDFDGKSTLSKVIAVKFGATSTFSIFPNPIKRDESITVRFTNTEDNVFVQLLDINQRIVRQKTFSGPQQNIEVSTQALQPGMYVLKIQSKAGTYSSKVVITP
ncbi:MAG: T9SS C-terminal target domain-containing protein [Bacteroidetes bacterium]|nr:MAG: T9SS C-terminal target domain-containing protein [Bacteroidota bacterium]